MDGGIQPEDESAVLDALARIDQLRGQGLEPDRIAETMSADGMPVPAGGDWDGDKVERILGVFDSVRHQAPSPPPIESRASGGSMDRPTPVLAMDATPTDDEAIEPSGDGGSTGPSAAASVARWALISLLMAGIGAGGYLLIDAVGGGPGSAPEVVSDAETADEAASVPTTEQPSPADTMAIRIETDGPDPAGADGDLVAATATIRSDGRLYVEGAFATSADAEVFLEQAGEVFGRENIVESYVIDADAPGPKVADVALDKPVLFESGTAVIHPDYIAFLEACAGVLELNPHIVMSVAAYTDSIGDEDFNLALSQKRAQAIVDFYREREIGDDQLVALGFGEADPVAPNDTDEGRSRNRRAMLELLNVVGEEAASLDSE